MASSKTLKIPNVKSFREDFIQPLCAFTDVARFKVTNNDLSYYVQDQENTFILSKYDTTEARNIFIEDFFFDLKNLKKFYIMLSTIKEENIVLTIHDNHVRYSADDFDIKMHMADPVTIKIPKYSVERLNSINFDISFSMPEAVTSRLDQMSILAGNSEKLYFKQVGGNIMGTFTDETAFNVDSVSFKICEYQGSAFEPFIIMFDTLKSKVPFKRNVVEINYSTTIKSLVKINVIKGNTLISYFTGVGSK